MSVILDFLSKDDRMILDTLVMTCQGANSRIGTKILKNTLKRKMKEKGLRRYISGSVIVKMEHGEIKFIERCSKPSHQPISQLPL